MSITAASLPSTTQRRQSAMPYTVVLPPRLADTRPTAEVYVRRRLLVGLVFVAVVVAVCLGAGNVLASRSGEPASAAAARPAITYVVQPGDTLWSIASARQGGSAVSSYVDLLVERNGGATIQVGQVLTLP
jgi:LysM repeat protein